MKKKEIVETYRNSDLTQYEVADRFGVSQPQVSKLCREFGVNTGRMTQEERNNIELSEEQRNILNGIVMGDGSIIERDGCPRLSINMTNKKFLEWVDKKMGKITTGVKSYKSPEKLAKEKRESGWDESAKAENYSRIYTLYSRKIPELQQWASWYSQGKKYWPEDLTLNDLSLSVLYCCDGNIQAREESPRIHIRTINEKENKDKVEKIFTNSRYNINFYESGRIYMPKQQSKKFFDRTEPLPGFSYKWP